jgi:hypothetical protein
MAGWLQDNGDAAKYINAQFIVDILVWYHLAWMGETVKLTDPRLAFYFVSTLAIAQTPTKQPALRLSRTKNLHFAKATFPGFSARALLIVR